MIRHNVLPTDLHGYNTRVLNHPGASKNSLISGTIKGKGSCRTEQSTNESQNQRTIFVNLSMERCIPKLQRSWLEFVCICKVASFGFIPCDVFQCFRLGDCTTFQALDWATLSQSETGYSEWYPLFICGEEELSGHFAFQHMRQLHRESDGSKESDRGNEAEDWIMATLKPRKTPGGEDKLESELPMEGQN